MFKSLDEELDYWDGRSNLSLRSGEDSRVISLITSGNLYVDHEGRIRKVQPDAEKCQKCGKPGGIHVDYQVAGGRMSRWECPHCDINREVTLRSTALGLYEPPFTYAYGYIQDSRGALIADDGGSMNRIARVRGWGEIFKGRPDGQELQDEVGKMIADALNALWKKETNT